MKKKLILATLMFSTLLSTTIHSSVSLDTPTSIAAKLGRIAIGKAAGGTTAYIKRGLIPSFFSKLISPLKAVHASLKDFSNEIDVKFAETWKDENIEATLHAEAKYPPTDSMPGFFE